MASFALERFKCVSKILPCIPVMLPVSSMTTTCIASFLPCLWATKLLVTGLGAIDFQKTVALVNPRVCESYQSVCVATASVLPVAPPPPVLIPELFTKCSVLPTTNDLLGSPSA